MRPRRVLVLTQHDLVPPEGLHEEVDVVKARWKSDYDVRNALTELGHDVRIVGHDEELADIRAEIDDFRPHIVFNHLELFANQARFMPYVLGYLELIDQAYTGCNPVGMMFSLDKALQRKILRHHRIRVPEFAIVPRGRRVRRPPRLEFPLIVKSPVEHGSLGIAQASVVTSDERLAERVQYIHERIGTDAIIEEYVQGVEVYQGILGNERLEAFPAWELVMENLPDAAPNIYTHRMKWDVDYQERVGLRLKRAELPEALASRVQRVCKRAYRALEQSGYARFDLRIDAQERIVIIESNPNPDLAWDAEFASAAGAAGYSFPQLIGRILNLGFRWSKRLRGC